MNKKTVLITGACGYLGGHVVRQFAADGNSAGMVIRLFDNLSAGSESAFADLPEGPKYEFVEGDILAPGAIRAALHGVETVVHLAAQVRTPFTFDQPSSVAQVNHWGTVRLLEHCREAGVRRFVFASSASVYGPGENFDEGSECRPIGPYSCSKREAEAEVLSANAADFETTVLRVAMLYGGELSLVRYNAVPNRFAYLTGIGRSIPIFGTGQQRRPVIHAVDAARACVWALRQQGIGGEVFNVVEANPTIESIAQCLAAHHPAPRLRYTDQDYRDHLSLSVSGAKLLAAGWAPTRDLTSGLGELLDHFRALSPFGVDSKNS